MPSTNKEPVAQTDSGRVDARALSAAIKRGDDAAFSRFYELYSRRLYGLLLFLTAGNEPLAREILQTTMIKAARKFPLLATEGEMWAWLKQVARHALADHFRDLARRPDRSPVELPDANCVGAESGERALLDWLQQSLEKLEPEDRDLLASAYFDRRPQQELADEGGTTRKAIESRLARIRAKLRQMILERLKDEQRT